MFLPHVLPHSLSDGAVASQLVTTPIFFSFPCVVASPLNAKQDTTAAALRVPTPVAPVENWEFSPCFQLIFGRMYFFLFRKAWIRKSLIHAEPLSMYGPPTSRSVVNGKRVSRRSSEDNSFFEIGKGHSRNPTSLHPPFPPLDP